MLSLTKVLGGSARGLAFWSLTVLPSLVGVGCVSGPPEEDDINRSQLWLMREDEGDDGLPDPELAQDGGWQDEESRQLLKSKAEVPGSAVSEALDIDTYLAEQKAAKVRVLEWEDRAPDVRGRPQRVKLEVVRAIQLGKLGARLEERQAQLEEATRRGAYQIYSVKKGDTLQEIALRLLGSARRWVEIAEINGIGADGLIFVGEKIAYPAP